MHTPEESTAVTPELAPVPLGTAPAAGTTTPPRETQTPALSGCLWTVREAAAFLRKSPRWVFYTLKLTDTEPGSIPHSKLGRNPRFIPDDLRTWAAQGFPPAATFRAWKDAEERRRKRAG